MSPWGFDSRSRLKVSHAQKSPACSNRRYSELAVTWLVPPLFEVATHNPSRTEASKDNTGVYLQAQVAKGERVP